MFLRLWAIRHGSKNKVDLPIFSAESARWEFFLKQTSTMEEEEEEKDDDDDDGVDQPEEEEQNQSEASLSMVNDDKECV